MHKYFVRAMALVMVVGERERVKGKSGEERKCDLVLVKIWVLVDRKLGDLRSKVTNGKCAYAIVCPHVIQELVLP